MSASSTTPPRTASEPLAEAAEWRLLALLFACPQGDWHNQAAALAKEVRDDTLQLAAQVAVEEGQESAYHTAFGPGGPAAPREVSHRPTALSGQYLSEILAFYDAFAYCSPRDEPPDHIAAEIDFIAYLRLKQAYAMTQEMEANVAVTAEAAERFIGDHLATIAEPLAQNLEASGIRYLALAAQALLERIGPSPVKSGSSPGEFEQIGNPTLPICGPGDCCAEFSD